MLVRLLKEYPDLAKADEARKKLRANISASNIEGEIEYFERPQEKSYERTYGWAWLLKLAHELATWDDPLGNELSKNLQPLTDLIVARYLEFLPKLKYPIRVGEHTNTAFGLTFAWDYALSVDHIELQRAIRSSAVAFYAEDQACPINWEPSGYDFLSPCFEEIDIMRRVMEKEAFLEWLNGFMPDLSRPNFHLDPGEVSDRSDGEVSSFGWAEFQPCLVPIWPGKRLSRV